MGLFKKVGKSITGGITGGIKSGVSSLIGAAAGKGADALFGTSGPYTGHLKKGIQWRVEDAKRAGVHPLFALGASLGSPVGTSSPSVGDAVHDAVGQGIQRGFGAPERQRQRQMQAEAHAASIEETYARAAAARSQAHRDFVLSQEALSNVSRAKGRANIKQDDVSPEGGRKLTVPGLGLKLTTGASTTAEDIEREYGDFMSWMWGAGRAGVDVFNSSRRAIKKHGTLVVPRGRRTSVDPFRGSGLY